MSTFSEGDLVTLALADGHYLLAKIVYVEDLTLHDLMHLMIYDVLLEEGPPGFNDQGEPQERTHVLPDVSTLKVVIDHIALTSPAFEEGDPLVVGHEEVLDEDRRGYAAWVAMQRDRAVRRGQIRDDADEEVEDDAEWDGEGEEDGEEEEYAEYADIDGEEDSDDDSESEELDDEEEEEIIMEGEEETIETEEGEFITIKTHTWHDTSFDISIAQALVDLADVFRQEEFAGSPVAEAIIRQTQASSEEIQELIDRLVNDGDYGAGQELLIYGDPAADALYEALKGTKDEQTVTDILQILGDSGTDRAYEHIAEFFVNRIDGLPSDPIAVAAARAFCYVVMLTGGSPEPLRTHLRLLERLDYPELRDDAEDAIRAIEEQGTDVPEPGSQVGSKDPFSPLGM